jgi:hypothetical protein
MGENPLDYAINAGKKDVIELLLDFSATIHEKTLDSAADEVGQFIQQYRGIKILKSHEMRKFFFFYTKSEFFSFFQRPKNHLNLCKIPQIMNLVIFPN